MNIKELYKLMQSSIFDELKGDLDLHKNNCIIYKYDLSHDDDQYFEYDNSEDDYYGFDSISNEEQLQDTCDEDLEIITTFLDENNELDNFSISDSEIKKSIICFKIQSLI